MIHLIDVRIADWLLHYRVGWLTEFFLLVTALTTSASLLVLGAALLSACLFYGRYRAGQIILLGAGLAFVLQFILKIIILRPRPAAWPALIEVPGYSFPSGHALVGATTLGLIAYYLVHTRRGRKYQPWIWLITILVALIIGLSRIYLGAHWASDVVAGFALGAIISWLIVRFFNQRTVK